MDRVPLWAMVSVALLLLICLQSNFAHGKHNRHRADLSFKRSNTFRRAGPPPPPAFDAEGGMTETTKKKLLAEMNKYRYMHDASPLGVCKACSTKAMAWAGEIAKTGHVRPNHREGYGQTVFSTKDASMLAKGADFVGTFIAAYWYNQIKNYDFIKNEFKGLAADFTQLVWMKTEMVGFGSTKATDGTYYVVAYYTPSGNNESLSYYENVNRVTGAGDNECQLKCPEGWAPSNCACYRLYKDLTTWGDSVDRCNVLKSSLISIEDVNEDTNLKAMIAKNAVKGSWIGLSDTANKGTYQFVDGAPFVYSAWTYDAYNWVVRNPTENRNKCIFQKGSEGWEYKACTEPHPFVCKMKPNGILSFSVDFYFPGSTYTNDLVNPASLRYTTMKDNIEKAVNSTFASEIWYLGHTFYQFMPRETKEVAASTLLRFAPDARAPVDPIGKLRDFLRANDILKVLNVRLVPGSNRVSTPAVSQGACPGACSQDCFPECNPTCCSVQLGFGVTIPIAAPPPPPPMMTYAMPPPPPPPPPPMVYYPPPPPPPVAMPYQQPACPQMPSCPQQCAPACQPQCCSQSSVRSLYAGKRSKAPHAAAVHASASKSKLHHGKKN